MAKNFYNPLQNIQIDKEVPGPQGLPGADGADGIDGVNGIDGKTVLNGTAVPTTEGVDGDFYIKTDTNEIYGPKSGGLWGSPTSLVGPQGPSGSASWMPNSVPIGSILSGGATFFINGGAGVYLSFSGNSNDLIFINSALDNTQVYDGSNLALEIHWKISSNGGVGDVVDWIVEYAIITQNGDTNASTTAATQSIDVSTILQDELIVTQLTTIPGVTNGKVILINLTRNASGPGSDSYAGNAEILSMQIIKL